MGARTLLVGAQPLFLVGLRTTLQELGAVVIGEAAALDAALDLARRAQPDLVFLDLPRAGVSLALAALRAAVPCAKLVAFGVQAHADAAESASKAGAHSYLEKSATGPRELGALLDELARTSPARTQSGTRAIGPRLSPRELEVVVLVASGKSNREVADSLAISVRTVETHRARVMQKLGLQGAASLTLWAVNRGLVRP